jgi:hypothetical protein
LANGGGNRLNPPSLANGTGGVANDVDNGRSLLFISNVPLGGEIVGGEVGVTRVSPGSGGKGGLQWWWWSMRFFKKI